MRLRTCRRCKGPGTFNTVPGQRICDRCRKEPRGAATLRQRAWALARDEANMVLRERHEDEWQAIFDAEFDRVLEQETPPVSDGGRFSGLAEGEGQTQASEYRPGD